MTDVPAPGTLTVRRARRPRPAIGSHRVLLGGGVLRGLLIGGVLAILVLSAAGLGRAQAVSGASPSRGTAALNENTSLGASPTPTLEKPLNGKEGSAPNSTAFDQWVAQTANALSQAGVPPRDIRLPYVGRPAEMVNGVAIPGDTLPPGNWSSFYTRPPAPSGIAYYGENDTSGRTEATTLNASSVVGTLTVNQLNTLYPDDDTPDMWGIQLNAILSNVTLEGVPGNQFWVQNAATYAPHDGTLNFGEDTWNTSSSTAFGIPNGNSTILRHNPNGSDIGGIYTGFGPYVYAPTPFTLTLYLNTSLTADGEQELWFNYSVLAAGGIHAHGSYDWIVFHSTSPQYPAGVGLPSFEASGTHLSPGGMLYDYELDFGIGPEDGSNMDVLAANVSATLDYCPATVASCTSDQYRSVPAAEDFGGDTGETSTGLSMSYVGTTEFASPGPFILRGLWGFPAAAGSASGFTPVTNAITVSGSPDPTSATPYVFVFFNGSSIINPEFEWAPDEPVWYLPPGAYRYEVMLADYAEQTGTLVVGTCPTQLSVTLPYHPSSGVYTPLWAFGNSQLAGISTSGDGSQSNQYRLFNNPTAGCTACGNAKDGDLSPAFAWWNDFDFPTFAGILIDGTNAYVDIDHPVSFCVFGFTYGPPSQPLPGPYFYLQIEFVSAHHVTLANDPFVGGWPAMYELETLAGLLDAAENPFPTANVVIWNSSDNLVMSNTFVPAWLAPAYEVKCVGVCPAVACDSCVPPDGLLLYGGRNNTIWGNTFRDPSPPASAPLEYYAGLAEAESGDLIFNNIFLVDNPTVYLPFDIYNNSCWAGLAGNCFPPLPPTYADTWNVTNQSASNVAATVNGFALSGNVLGPGCGNQGGNYWQDYGTPPNPYGALPFVNAFDYTALLTALPPGTSSTQNSIRIGGDYAPLNRSTCPTLSSPFWSVLLNPYAIGGLVAVVAVVTGVVVLTRTRWKMRPAPWLLPPAGGVTASPQGEVSTPGASGVVSAQVALAPPRPTLRERWARQPPSLGFLVGAGMLAVYLVAAVSAVFVFGSSLGSLPKNEAWVPPYNPIGPSASHLFGVMPGFGTDLFNAIWRATPWDLAIVVGILAIDGFLGFFLGAIAGLDEGGLADAIVTFVGDSLGSIPTFLLAIVVFAGLLTVAPNAVGLPVFVAVFGIILWPTMARTVRERARTIAHERYVEAARASGASFPSILITHVLPNALGPVLAQLPLDVAPIFFVLSAFPWYYNCQLPGGPPPPPGHPPPPPVPYLVPSLPFFSPLPSIQFPEWGYLLGFGTCEGFSFPGGFDYWWMYLFPLLAIVGLGVALGLLCDGIERWRQFNR